MNKFNINPTNFETLENYLVDWRVAVNHEKRSYEDALREKSDEQRRARHMSQTGQHQATDHECLHCGRSLRSRAGLASHIRVQQSEGSDVFALKVYPMLVSIRC